MLQIEGVRTYYGDSLNFPAADPRQWMAVLPIQYGWLRQWAAGDFDADWPAEGLSFPERLQDRRLCVDRVRAAHPLVEAVRDKVVANDTPKKPTPPR